MNRIWRRTCVAVWTVMMAGTTGLADGPMASPREPLVMTLEQCLETAMAKNRQRPASGFAVAMAEAQHRQTLAGYWPQVNAKAGVTRLDEAINFLFPAGQMVIPPQSVNVPGGSAMVSIPANAFGPGFPPAPVQMPVAFPGQQVSTQMQMFPIPPQDVRVVDPTVAITAVRGTWLLYDGGMRKGYREQAKGGIDIARAEQRRTDLEITDSVVRLYYGAILARKLRQLGDDTVARMGVTLELTESLYKNGSERVTKLEYLDNKLVVESLHSMVAALARNEAAAEAALAYTIGLAWDETVRPADDELPNATYSGDLSEMVTTAYEFNPDWTKLEAGLRALEGSAKTARSGYFPKVAVTGQLHRWWNGYDAGAYTQANRAGWIIGAGAEIPIFDGNLTRNKVAEARARISKLKEERILLKEGIGLQVRDLFLELDAVTRTLQATERAKDAAVENRELAARAYESELVETEKVIRTQIYESLAVAQYWKSRYDRLAVESRMSLVIGKQLQRELGLIP
jgi:outer membrane protein